MSEPGSRRNSLDSLQIGRGIAAIAVVWNHVGLLMLQERYLNGADNVPLFNWTIPGYHGVDYFFVLSGFIIAHAHWNDIGDPRALGRYAWRRAIRIFPPYWVVTTLLLLIYTIKPEFGTAAQRETFTIVSSYLLLPFGDVSVLPVAWTLRYEMLFYVSFTVFIAFGSRIGAIVFPLWFAYILLMGEPTTQVVSLASQHILQFMLGFVACGIAKKVSLSNATALALTAIGVLSIVTLYVLEAVYAPTFEPVPVNLIAHLRDRYGLVAWGLASAVAILGMTQRDRNRAASGKRSLLFKTFQLLGDASYSLYLFHVVALSALAVMLFKLMPSVMQAVPVLTVFVLFIGGTIGGVLFHLLVEKPLLLAIPKNPPVWFGPRRQIAQKTGHS